jgi:amidohydrolase
MTGREILRQRVIGAIDAASVELTDLARFIHANPELQLEEFKAAARCSETLEVHGFQVDRGVADLPTAFVARRGQGRPVVGILVEYDALLGIGHGCGHNLLAGATIGAGIGAGAVVGEVPGSIWVFGTPGEERKGGKVHMLRAGLFRGVDAVLSTHPGAGPTAYVPTIPGSGAHLAAQWLDIEFFGKPAHAGADPHKGVNALNALIETFNGINALRQHIRPSARIHGVIRSGGEAVNVVPAYSRAEFMVRAETRAERDGLLQKVRDVVQGAALMTGCTSRVSESDAPYDDVVSNRALARQIKANFDAVGLETPPPFAHAGIASSDLGNVSYAVPTGLSLFPIADEDIPWHSQTCAEAANTDRAYAAMLKAAQGLALAALDVLTNAAVLEEARREFEESTRGK